MVFLDTNIFIYAHDASDKQKSTTARSVILEHIESQQACISTQVIQEFCNVVLKKSKKPLKADDVRDIVQQLFLPLLAHYPSIPFYLRALQLYTRYSLSYYDSLIVQAAIDMQCSILYSEDLQDGAVYESVHVVNPFI